MSAIITDQIRILNAKNFVAGVSTDTNAYYAFVGLPNPTGIRTDWDENPPAPVDSFNDTNNYWDDMIAVKKITPADVKQIVKKNTWSSGTTYDYYRHDYSISNAPPNSGGTTLYTANFYVVNSDYRVYICLQNGTTPETPDGKPSLDEPTFTDLEPSRAGNSGDGYIWKYMYTVSPADILKFDSTEYITVPNNWSTSNDAQIKAIRENGDSTLNNNQIKHVYIEDGGGKYSEGLGQEVDIVGDGTGGKARVDVVGKVVTDVAVSSGGSGYSYGLVDLGGLQDADHPSNQRAKLVPIIPPSLGHGYDIYKELGTDRVLIYARFDDSTKDFPSDTKFAQVGIVKNPTKVGTVDLYTQPTFSSMSAFIFDTVSANEPLVGERITQVLPDQRIAQGYVASYDKDTKVMKYFRDRSLNFTTPSNDHKDYAGISTTGRIYDFSASGGSIKGDSSGFSASINANFSGITTNPTGTKLIDLGITFSGGLSNTEINKGSGEIVYLDNRPLIARNERQKEDVKIILEF